MVPFAVLGRERTDGDGRVSGSDGGTRFLSCTRREMDDVNAQPRVCYTLGLTLEASVDMSCLCWCVACCVFGEINDHRNGLIHNKKAPSSAQHTSIDEKKSS